MFGLFAFHSARASVVIAKQPTCTWLRIDPRRDHRPGRDAGGEPTTTARPRGCEPPDEERREPERQQDQPRVAEDREAEHGACRDRVPGRPSLVGDEREQGDRREEEPVDDLAIDVHVVPDRRTDGAS